MMPVERLPYSNISKPGGDRLVTTVPLESFTTDPFMNNRDSRFYFGTASHETALTQLQAMLDDGNLGWGSLCSSPGLGKTLLRTMLHSSLDPQRFVAVSIETSLLSFNELLLEIISQLSGERAYNSEFPDRYSRLSEFKLLLTQHIANSGRHLAIFLDEAHGLDEDTLEGLRNLSNIGAEQYNLMTFILIGTSKLESRLRHMSELDQRIAVRTTLAPLDKQQTRDYVHHRLQVAGCDQSITFSSDSWKRLYQVSHGIPREINKVLKHSMSLAQRIGSAFGDDSLQQSLSALRGSYATGNSEFNSLGMT